MNSTQHTPAFAFAALALCTLLLTGCNDGDHRVAPPDQRDRQIDEVGPGNLLVFEWRGSIQCTSDGISPEQSAQTLINGGIDVLRSVCGFQTGIAHPAVCGAGTSEILVHEIREENLPHAEEHGFAGIGTLVDGVVGTDYELLDCSDRPPVPVVER